MFSKIDKVKTAVLKIANKYNLKRVALFGSVARGDDSEKSDIDLLVEFEEGKSLLDLVGLKLELQDILGNKVDIITYSSLHPLLKDKILREQKVIL